MKETVGANAKLGKKDALALAASASRVIIAKGKKISTFSMTRKPPGDKIMLTHMLGPTGNLRAPTIRKGKTLLVGFNDDIYRSVFRV